MMAVALDGVTGWSRMGLAGSARPRRAGAVAPTAARWGALTVLESAWRRAGAPAPLRSESGGASLSEDFAAVCTRGEMDHQPLIRTQGASSMTRLETPGHIQRRWYAAPWALTPTPWECARAHQDLLQLSHTPAPQGLRTEQCTPPIPLAVLGAARGRRSTPAALARQCSRALLPRTTHRYGCVPWHREQCYGAEGLPKTPVGLWGSGHARRALVDNVGCADDHGQYERRERNVQDLRAGRFLPTRFASTHGARRALKPQASWGLDRPKPVRPHARRPFPAQPLWRFERVETA
jgi:hypothetical protein